MNKQYFFVLETWKFSQINVGQSIKLSAITVLEERNKKCTGMHVIRHILNFDKRCNQSHKFTFFFYLEVSLVLISLRVRFGVTGIVAVPLRS